MSIYFYRKKERLSYVKEGFKEDHFMIAIGEFVARTSLVTLDHD